MRVSLQRRDLIQDTQLRRGAPVQAVADARVLAAVEAEFLDEKVNNGCFLVFALFQGPLEIGRVQEHFADRQDVDEGVKLLNIAGEAAEEVLVGLSCREENLAFDFTLGLSASQDVEECCFARA